RNLDPEVLYREEGLTHAGAGGRRRPTRDSPGRSLDRPAARRGSGLRIDRRPSGSGRRPSGAGLTYAPRAVGGSLGWPAARNGRGGQRSRRGSLDRPSARRGSGLRPPRRGSLTFDAEEIGHAVTEQDEGQSGVEARESGDRGDPPSLAEELPSLGHHHPP